MEGSKVSEAMNKPQQDLAKLYEIHGWQQPSPNQIREALTDYIDTKIVIPLENQNSHASPAIKEEASTIAYSVGGYAYTKGHEQGWNDALNFISHFGREFVTNEDDTSETYVEMTTGKRTLVY